MTITAGPNLGLMENAATGEAHDAELRRFMRGVDGLVQSSVKDKDLATPPGSPANGDRYIVATSPTGAWTGQAGKIARWTTEGTPRWEFYTPKEGWSVALEDEDIDYRHNGTTWAPIGDGLVPKGYIDGLRFEWLSGTSLRVTTGAAYVESLGRILAAASAITKSGLSLSANTWYHVYLFSNAGTADIEIVTTAAAAAYSGTARSKTGDASRRYLGSVRTNASGALHQIMMTGSRITYLEKTDAAPFRALSGGMATAVTTVSLAALLPPNTQLAQLRFTNTDTVQGVGLSTSLTPATYITPVGAKESLSADFPVDASQAVTYFYGSAPTNGFFIDVYGYLFER